MGDTEQMKTGLPNRAEATAEEAEAPRRAWSKVAPPLIGLGALIGAAGFVGMVNPNTSSVYPLCPTQALLGIDCPGCGGLRCIHELMNGNVAGAADQNLLVVVVLPLVLIALAAAIARRFMNTPDEPPGLFANTLGSLRTVGVSINQRALMLTLLVGVVVFTIARNLPFVPFLGSGIG